jgi:hypothetical protein
MLSATAPNATIWSSPPVIITFSRSGSSGSGRQSCCGTLARSQGKTARWRWRRCESGNRRQVRGRHPTPRQRQPVTAEAGAWNLVVVPDHQSAKRTICRVTVSRDYKMVSCFKPSMIAAIKRFLGPQLEHCCFPIASRVDVRFGDGYGAKAPARLVSRSRTARSIR